MSRSCVNSDSRDAQPSRFKHHDVLPGGCHRIGLSSAKWYPCQRTAVGPCTVASHGINTVSEDMRYEIAQCSIFSSYPYHIAFQYVRGSYSHSSKYLPFDQSIGTALPEQLLGYPGNIHHRDSKTKDMVHSSASHFTNTIRFLVKAPWMYAAEYYTPRILFSWSNGKDAETNSNTDAY